MSISFDSALECAGMNMFVFLLFLVEEKQCVELSL